jgi:hypothetical protein
MPRLGTEYTPSKEHVENVRKASITREANKGNDVSIHGVRYPNASVAGRACNLHARTIIRYCRSTKSAHSSYFIIKPKVPL